MDSDLKRNFSYPNADRNMDQQENSGATRATNSDVLLTDSSEPTARRTVNIMDALANAKSDTGDAQTVRTYQSDIANTIKNDNVSMIKVALSEKKRQERRGALDNTLEDSHKNTYIIIGLVFSLIVITGLVAGFIFLRSQSSNQPLTTEQQKVEPLLYTELVSVLNIGQIDATAVFSLIEKDREALMELGDTKSIVFTVGSSTEERPLTTIEFFNLIQSRAPDILQRSLDPKFLLGIYGVNPRDVFAVFKVTSYDSAFAGMLEWEPNIESDIGDVFINKKERVDTTISNLIQSTSTASTTQVSPYGVFSQRVFVDKILNNKDARVLVDTNGKEALLYTFLDKETLVIATTERSLKEIVFRLTTGRIVR